MAVTVGTNGYITVTDFKAWADSRGYTYGADELVEAAIVVASVDFIDTNYKFRGDPLSPTQEMQLPTNEVAIEDIQNAAAQAAYLQLIGRLFVDPANLGQGGQITSESKKLGTLSTSTSYAEGYQYTTLYPTISIDNLMKKYIVSAGMGTLIRG